MLNQRQVLIVFLFYLRKILKDDSGRSERNFSGLLRGFSPVEDGVNVLFLHREVVAITDGALKEDTDGVREGCYRK